MYMLCVLRTCRVLYRAARAHAKLIQATCPEAPTAMRAIYTVPVDIVGLCVYHNALGVLPARECCVSNLQSPFDW